MPIGKPHIITVSDAQRGIQWLAAYLLGDASQWTTLVDVNQLTPPYITSDPSQVYGPPIVTTSLTKPVSKGANQIPLPNYLQTFTLAYLSAVGTNGLIAESAEVANYDGDTLTFATPLQNAYPTGARIQLFSGYEVQNKVLLPGDILFVPVDTNSFTVADNQQLVDSFGSDIASSLQFSNGDLAVVSGLDTLLQRMRIALQTELGSLPLHPEFGSQLSQSVGTPIQSVKWAAVVSNCLTQLPEIDSVANTQVTIDGTIAYVTATVNVSTSDAPLQLQNEPFTLTSTPIPTTQ